MHKTTKQRDDEKKKRPKFEVRTLGADELCRVTGGVAPETASTHCGCHVDGVCDSEGG
ncbi:hypothetical protein SAMN02745121_05299 [Nannocystis exedens]|uniref:Uncharacterized protein n=1 Tax=Nannocystis exedens TaxID=54 RepID=A0A1I2CWD6_9BACT|nr:hypothetical protein [Nannocystis exedens]PCC68625.1 hypothetical protein NAEX_01641 [Nannocystis exedens]SFE72604.1 hypothetical protein SAMN02745121_05299 [Nannocystis exedens]